MAIKIKTSLGVDGSLTTGEYGVSTGHIKFDTTPTNIPTSLGTCYWDTFYRTASLIDGIGNTTLQIGQEERVLVHNNTGVDITDGQVVYVTGSTGELPSVALANANSEATSSTTIGVATEVIPNGVQGFIITSGIIHNLNTLAFNEGELLWLSTTSGAFTNVAPISPNHLVLIGYVIKKAGGNGSILVKIQNTQELKECSDVLFTTLTNNDVLTYESTTSLWKNKSISTILGYTPANDSSVVHKSLTEIITGYKTFTNLLDSQGGFLSSFASTNAFNAGGTNITINNSSVGANSIEFNINNTIGFSYRVGVDTDGLFKIGSSAETTKFTFSKATGLLTTSGFVKTGGTSSQFLKADGSVDSSVYSVDANVVHLAGNETITGQKTFQNSTNGDAIIILNTSTSGRGLRLNSITGSTFDLIQTLRNGVETGKIDYLGNITAPSFIKSGGTASQFLKADGSVDSNSYQTILTNPVTGTGTSGYVSFFNGTSSITGDSGLFWDNVGKKLGIGTTSPTGKLHLASDSDIYFKISRASGSFASQFYRNASNGSLELQTLLSDNSTTHSYIYIDEGNSSHATSKLILQSQGGNVGIGTTSPDYPLEVETAANTFLSVGSTGASSGRAMLFLDKKGTPTKYNWLAGAQYNVDNGFEITPSSAIGGTTFSTPAIAIKTDGNIGVGTNSPDVIANYKNIHIQGTNGGSLTLKNTSSIGGSIQGNSGGLSYVVGASLDHIFYNNGNPNLLVKASGNTLIGTSTDSGDRVTVSGTLSTGGSSIRMINSTTGNYATIKAGISGITNGGMEFSTDSVSRMVISTGGYVGIGISSPLTDLHVDGNVTYSLPTAGATTGEVVYFGTGTTFTAGNLYYFSNTGAWVACNAGAASTSSGLLAIALGTAVANGMLVRGHARFTTASYTGATIGQTLYASTTAGTFSGTAPTGSTQVVRVIGYCTDATNDVIYFCPDTTWITLV